MMKIIRKPIIGALLAAVATAGCVTTNFDQTLKNDDLLYGEFDLDGLRELPDDLRPMPHGTSMEHPADGPLEITLEQAALMALENNRDLQVRQLRPVIAGAYSMIERGVYDPQLFAELRMVDQKSIETARATEDQFEFRAERSSAALGLRQRTPVGTDLELALEQDRSDSDRTPEQFEGAVRLSITQSLLRGFGPAVNLAAIRQADYGAAASLFELRAFIEALLADTETAYWNFVLAEKKTDIFQRSLEIAERQRDEIEERIDVGVLAPTEAAAARAEVALRQQALIDSHHERERRRLLLLRRINSDPTGMLDTELRTSTTARTEADPITDGGERVALARLLRSDMNEARMLFEQNRLEVVVTRDGLMPRLDFFVELRKTGYSDRMSDSFANIGSDSTYDLAAGLRMSHFIGNRRARARDTIARVNIRQGEAALRNLHQQVILEVKLALSEVERARQQIDASAITRELEEKSLAAEQERFAVGTSTALLVAQAQRDLLAGQIAEVEALVNYRIALVNLYRAEGSLLERRGIELPAADIADAFTHIGMKTARREWRDEL